MNEGKQAMASQEERGLRDSNECGEGWLASKKEKREVFKWDWREQRKIEIEKRVPRDKLGFLDFIKPVPSSI